MLIHTNILNFQLDTHKIENSTGDCVSKRVRELEKDGKGGEERGRGC